MRRSVYCPQTCEGSWSPRRPQGKLQLPLTNDGPEYPRTAASPGELRPMPEFRLGSAWHPPQSRDVPEKPARPDRAPGARPAALRPSRSRSSSRKPRAHHGRPGRHLTGDIGKPGRPGSPHALRPGHQHTTPGTPSPARARIRSPAITPADMAPSSRSALSPAPASRWAMRPGGPERLVTAPAPATRDGPCRAE